jgi:hypothetical protein
MFKRIALAVLLFATAPIAAANAQGFVVGMVVGGMMFGGNTYSGAAATILYSANEETLKGVDPLEVRLVAFDGCFEGGDRSAHKSIGEMFASVTKKQADKKQTILQVARVFYPSAARCASIWFAYTEK